MCRKGLNMWWYLVIGLCIGFVAGSITGIVLTSLMAAASRDDRSREPQTFYEVLEKLERGEYE